MKVEIIHKKEGKSSKSQHLAVIFQKTKSSLLWTTGKQSTPSCSSCSSFKCQCVREWRKNLEKDAELDVMIDKIDTNITEENNTNIEDDLHKNSERVAHYMLKEEKLGYNTSDIVFPLYDCPKQKNVIDKKNNGTYKLPGALIPLYDEANKCEEHGNRYNEDDNNLKLCANQVVVYTEDGETVIDCKVYYRE